MTGTKQLLGHFYRLLDLLWQMLNRGHPTPTNSTGKKTLPGSITGSLAPAPVNPQPLSFTLSGSLAAFNSPVKSNDNVTEWR